MSRIKEEFVPILFAWINDDNNQEKLAAAINNAVAGYRSDYDQFINSRKPKKVDQGKKEMAVAEQPEEPDTEKEKDVTEQPKNSDNENSTFDLFLKTVKVLHTAGSVVAATAANALQDVFAFTKESMVHDSSPSFFQTYSLQVLSDQAKEVFFRLDEWKEGSWTVSNGISDSLKLTSIKVRIVANVARSCLLMLGNEDVEHSEFVEILPEEERKGKVDMQKFHGLVNQLLHEDGLAKVLWLVLYGYSLSSKSVAAEKREAVAMELSPH